MGWEDFGDGTDESTHRQSYLGRGLFVGGTGLLLVAVVLTASVGVAGALGLGTTGARELAGALAGIGLAATLVGTLAVVPTDQGTWHRAIGGACLAVLGVGAFLWAYPGRWYGDGVDLTLSVLAVYALGIAVVAAYLFASVADLARRAGRAEALVAAMPSVGDPTSAAGTGTANAEKTNGMEADGDDDTVLYERSSDPEPSNGNGSGSAADRTVATEPAAPTIDRIEPSGEAFSWEDSGFRIEPIDRPDSNGRSTVSSRKSPAADANGRDFEAFGADRESANGNREQPSKRDGERTPVAIASNGANGSETATADARSLSSAEPKGSVDRIDSPDTTETRAAVRSTRSSIGPTGTDEPDETRTIEAESESGSTPTEREAPSASVDGGVDTLQFGPSVDRYCGNCGHFQYVRTENGLSPYCEYHEEVMDDMEPCLGWTSNS
ncbi:hypothetical protein BRC86_05170 [Halobacteriales archaeon QS_3_64_16]|nr:MAG: hypothetical protein BRC86_05170 [Halobacteriales archaeon QS_3_64_16]